MASVRGLRRESRPRSPAGLGTVLQLHDAARSPRGAQADRSAGIAAGHHHAAALLALAAALTWSSGCRSGGSTGASSWSMFGGSNKTGDSLAAAPAFDGSVSKPSETAKPYPTTSTPDGYVIAKNPPANGDGAAPAEASDVGPVVYGSAPPPAIASNQAGQAAAATPATVNAAPGSGETPLSSITPQVGPYAASTPPAAAAAAPLAATAAPPAMPPAGGAAPDAAGSMFSRMPAADPAATPPERMADARTGSAWSADRAPSAPAADRYETPSRYADASNRFASPAAPPAGGFGGESAAAVGGTAAATPWPATPAAPPAAPAAPPAAADWPPSTPSTPPAFEPTAAPAQPAANPYPAAAAPPTSQPDFAPPAAPETLPAADPGAPLRRRDPVYRPGGTTSYRRLGEDGPVQPASFEAEAPPTP